MKKLLILTAVWMLTASAVGCQWCNAWSWGFPRQSSYSAPYYNYNDCDPCACTAAPACTCQ